MDNETKNKPAEIYFAQLPLDKIGVELEINTTLYSNLYRHQTESTFYPFRYRKYSSILLNYICSII